jgi:hypothetical protein
MHILIIGQTLEKLKGNKRGAIGPGDPYRNSRLESSVIGPSPSL